MKCLRIFLSIFLSFSLSLFLVPLVSAQQPLGTIGGEGLGPFGKISGTLASDATLGLTKVTNVISSIIGIMTVAGSIWFMFQILTAGIGWITAGGDKGKLETARNRLTDAMIGLFVLVAGWSILALAGQFFGYDIVLSNPAALIQQLGL